MCCSPLANLTKQILDRHSREGDCEDGKKQFGNLKNEFFTSGQVSMVFCAGQTCTRIIDFQIRELKNFKDVKGHALTHFVETYSEKSYCELLNKLMLSLSRC